MTPIDSANFIWDVIWELVEEPDQYSVQYTVTGSTGTIDYEKMIKSRSNPIWGNVVITPLEKMPIQNLVDLANSIIHRCITDVRFEAMYLSNSGPPSMSQTKFTKIPIVINPSLDDKEFYSAIIKFKL